MYKPSRLITADIYASLAERNWLIFRRGVLEAKEGYESCLGREIFVGCCEGWFGLKSGKRVGLKG
jgi:hypothetical protein